MAGVAVPKETHRLGGLGRGADAVTLTLDLAIVDASFPSISCWEFSTVAVEMVVAPDELEYPVLGWDLLAAFDLVVSAEQSRIELRPTRALLRGQRDAQSR